MSSDQLWLYTHGRPKWSVYYSDDALQTQLRFFDRFLKGEDNGMDEVPPVRLEVRESLEDYDVRFEEDWPLPSTSYQQLHLDAGSGTLSSDAPAQESATSYDPDGGEATFTVTFEEDTELTGYMSLRLWVSTSLGSDMDIFVAVRKLDATGEEVTFYAKTGYTLGPAAMGWRSVRAGPGR